MKNNVLLSVGTALLAALPMVGCASTPEPAPAAATTSAEKPAEGSCGGEKKAGEGSCGGEKKAGEGSCGEGSCGGEKKPQ
jgi:uncharacterized low-complexity protein